MRKTKEITIESGRDKGKKFVITEKSAMDTERFFLKVCCGIGSKLDIGAILIQFGETKDAKVLNNLISYIFSIEEEKLIDLYDELLDCIEFKAKDKDKYILVKANAGHFEEASTLMLLRTEVIKLHVNFS